MGLRLVEKIDADALLSKLCKEEETWKIAYYVNKITFTSKELATEIINRLNPKLREELSQNLRLNFLSILA